MRTTARPSDALAPHALAHAADEVVETLRDLIRIPSVNPPPERGDGELRVARYIASVLSDAGLQPEVVEPFPGRGSVHARLRGDGTGGEPFLLLSHLDVVPAPPAEWTHDPFDGDVADGYVYGRGAVDMKDLIAQQLGVVHLLAAEARAAGRDPASDPIPGLTRDVLITSTADEEAGGHHGAGWVAENHPEWLRAEGAINECGGVAVTVGDRRVYPIQVAEKGFAVYRIRVRGTWGHGSMPRDDNAALLAASVITRLAAPGDVRITPVMRHFVETTAEALGGEVATSLRGLLGADPHAAERRLAACDPMYARALRALVRDTISPDVIHAGIKYNVIPGEASLEIDCRVLPGMTEEDARRVVEERIGPELLAACEIELVIFGAPAESPHHHPLFGLLADTVRDHDPDAIPVPFMVPFATDAKHTAKLGVPTYGFSPLKLAPEERFLERFHGVDERVAIDALQWGLPVLYDVVRRFCG
ncbi:MAG TPA: M20/M25/M40 family metallo-hydrolase [Candidatus Limnocylindrales bacterium]|nr:M20/M25/M40 family metallo-hydrolase [Candidatus Limnocylindrales bacterium]